MGTKKTSLNAINALVQISREIEDTSYTILGHYDPSILQVIQETETRTEAATKEEFAASDLFQSNLKELGKLLSTTPIETLLFVAAYTCQENRCHDISTYDLCKFFGLNGLDFLPLSNHLGNLLKKRLLCLPERHNRTSSFRISKRATNCILKNVPYKKAAKEINDRYKFCRAISYFIANRDNGNIDTDDLFEMTEEEEECNIDIEFVSKTRKLIPAIKDRVLFYGICDNFISSSDHNTYVSRALEEIYDSFRSRCHETKAILDKTNPLIASGLAELLPTNFVENSTITLGPGGKKLLLEDDCDLFDMKSVQSDKRLVSADQLPDRQLFFNNELSKDLDFLKECLTDEKFNGLQARLKEINMPTGINVLMFGLPGTGKTASAEMIAKATGRSVFRVDIASSKSCWFGESEKLFKKIFDDYQNMCKTEERKPILLFNEADALFSKRKDVTTSNCATTENALQNILLEELEKMDGILIATTNLVDNLDQAFNRRFLFKIKFGQPDKATKKSIWKSKLAWLSDDDCGKLAANHDLSGGEIDNIVRKGEMEYLLHGTRPGLTNLEEWCRQEKISTGKGNAIGFSC